MATTTMNDPKHPDQEYLFNFIASPDEDEAAAVPSKSILEVEDSKLCIPIWNIFSHLHSLMNN